MEVLFFFSVILWIGTACLVGWVADQRGRGFALGFWLGLLLSPLLGVLVLLALPLQNKQQATVESSFVPRHGVGGSGLGHFSGEELALLTAEEVQFYSNSSSRDRELMLPTMRSKIEMRARDSGIDLGALGSTETSHPSKAGGVVSGSALTPDQRELSAYEVAADEIASGSQQKGLWAKAFADSEGDTQRQKALYLRYRADQLGRGH